MDLAKQMPTLGGVVLRAKLAGAKLIVIGERRQRIAENAEYFLQIRPGTETLLYGAMAKVIIDRGLMNLPFIGSNCAGYEAFLAKVQDYDMPAAAEACGFQPIKKVQPFPMGGGSAAILYSTGAECRPAGTETAVIRQRGAGKWADRESWGWDLRPHRPRQLCRVCATWGGCLTSLPGYQ